MMLGYLPHIHCYLGSWWLTWGHAATDGVIFVNYWLIPLLLLALWQERNAYPTLWRALEDPSHDRVHPIPPTQVAVLIVWFAVFILGCGVTHLFDVINLWHPYYWLDLGVRTITAIASVGATLTLWQTRSLLRNRS